MQRYSSSWILQNPSSGASFLFGSRRSPRSCIPQNQLGAVRLLWRSKMTISATPCIRDECLTVRGRPIFTRVPPHVVVSPAGSGSAFIGAAASESKSRHVFTIGALDRGYRLLCLFRFKIWWMIPKTGKSGCDIPLETQMLLLEVKEDSALGDKCLDSNDVNTFYILLLPVLDGDIRNSLQGTSTDELQFCAESGDPAIQCKQFLEAVFINSGDNPFKLMKDSIKMLEKHVGTFSHRETKKIPPNLDWFGWCTWDAFYTEVNPQGIKEGLESLLEGGCAPRFLIIDDGWQDTINEFRREGEPVIEGTQFATRLVDIKENEKFKGINTEGNTTTDFRDFIRNIKEKYGIRYVYMWHALVGYWGGVLPPSKAMKKYNPKIAYPVQSPGNVGNLRDFAMDSLEKYGVGMIDPMKISEFYNDLHSYLASQGVDGVKVDVQNVMETLGAGYGGRVSLTRQYQLALEASIARNFKDNNLICCMSHNSDSIYSLKKSAVARASEDFMPRKPTFQTLHIASVAFNSLLLGELVVPDWDMFHSKHETAEFHAASRAVGGCGVYVSDKPGHHDFNVLKKLVLPDGSVLRARYAGRPTRDCLFNDPVMDGKSLLKIWNLNKFTGIIGVFNCQGAGSWPWRERTQDDYASNVKQLILSAPVSPMDCEFLEDVCIENWTGDCAVFALTSGRLSRLTKKEYTEVSLGILQCEIFTISPVKDYNQMVQFAPLGLISMYNSGGAIDALNNTIDGRKCVLTIKARGCGRFGAYSSIKPQHCKVDAKEEEVNYDEVSGLLTFNISHSSNSSLREVAITYQVF